MRWLHGHSARAAVMIAVCAYLAVPLRPAAAEDDGPAIPPGQEELLLEMLGRGVALPEGCTLADGRIEHTTVKATYACPLGDVVVQLFHPSVAPAAATQTERFALGVDSGSPPVSLVDTLAARIRAREGEFAWLWPAEVEPAAIDDAIGERVAPAEPRW